MYTYRIEITFTKWQGDEFVSKIADLIRRTLIRVGVEARVTVEY